MIKPKVFIQRLKTFINASPQRKKFFLIILALAIIPVTVIAALTVQNLKQHAGGGSTIIISDQGGNTLYSTSSPNVFIDINLSATPNWALPETGVGMNNLVEKAYAISASCAPPYSGYLGCFSADSAPSGSICAGSCTTSDNQTGQYCYTSTKVGSSCIDDSGLSGTCNNQGDCLPTPTLILTSTPIPTEIINPSLIPTSPPPITLFPQVTTPTLTPNILRAIYIENKDIDGSTGGSYPIKIVVKSGADIAHISWKLNDLLFGQTQAPRTVQVTLIGDTIIVPYATTINLVTPTQPTPVIPTPSYDNLTQSILKSEFFITDPVAIDLVEKNLSRDIRAFADDPNLIVDNTTNSPNIFEYKVISALRMIGMTRPSNLPGTTYLGEVLLNKFQRLHNLEQTPFITSAVLKKIDSKLAIQEQKDKILAHQFPLYDKFTESPLNQPTKEHIAALYTLAFQVLPPYLVHWDDKWLESYLKLQFPATIVNSSSKDWKICTGAGLMYGIPDPCPQSLQLYPGKAQSPQANTTVIPVSDELNLIDAILHEYGHFLDKNAWISNDIAIDTRGFYDISFKDFDPASYPSPTDLTKYYKRDVSQNRNEFVSGYAAGNNFKEDFAESFTMYIMQGKTFRELSKQNEFLSQKYEWLKQNIFQNVEYDTGVYKNDTPRSIIGHPADYSLANPDYYFTYDFPKLYNLNYDLNADGVANCKDLKILIGQYGQRGNNVSADLNHDGVVDGIDYNILLKNYTPDDTTACLQ